MPHGSTGLPWALLTGTGVQLRWTGIDSEALANEVVAASSYLDVKEWADTYIRRPLSDTVAVEAFGPRDARRPDWNE